MAIVNSELLRLAKERFSKSAVVMNPAADPNAAAGAAGMPPADPAMGGAPPQDPAMAGAPPVDPAMAAVAGPPMGGGMGAPAPAPAPAPAAAPAQQKLKPEQMMQMIDYRLYNMQQQLTAIMNAMGVQLPPEAIVLPPGSTSAPPAEQALPGGAGAPPAAAPAPAGDPAAAQLPQDVYAGPDPSQTGGAVAPIQPTKAAWWQLADAPKAASYIGDPVPANNEAQQPINLQVSAGAASALLRSLTQNAR
jgi:hypothetical protein